MKKTNFKTIVILGVIVAILVSLVASASAAYINNSSFAMGVSTDDGYVTMDSFVGDIAGDVYVKDLFLTGGIGTPESTGVLSNPLHKPYDKQVHWTLKDGVLVLDAPSGEGAKDIDGGAALNSPFWNNPYIETIVISDNVGSIDRLAYGATFHFGLPNLKNVIFLDGTEFQPYYDGMTFKNNTPGPFGDFPTDHEINYVWTFVHTNLHKDRISYAYGKSGVGTSNIDVDFQSANDKNTFFEQSDRASFLAAAAPVIANAKLNQEAIDLMPDDMIAAVNAIGGFKNLVGGTDGAKNDPLAGYNGIKVTVQNRGDREAKPVIWTDAEPFVDANNRTMVPLRAVADAMGMKVDWNAELQYARFEKSCKSLDFYIGKTTAWANRGKIEMDTVPVIVNDRTYAPIRYLAEFYGYTVTWDASTQTVIITE